MKTYDRHLLKRFLVSLAISTPAIAGFYVIVDLFQNVDEIVDHLHEHEDVWRTMAACAKLYGAKVALYICRFGAGIVLVAAGFVVHQVGRGNEFTGLRAAGISIRRTLGPLLVSSLAIGLLLGIAQEFTLPKLLRNARAYKHELFGSRLGFRDPLTVHAREGAPEEIVGLARAVSISVDSYIPTTRTAKGFHAIVVDAGGLREIIRAPVAEWTGLRREDRRMSESTEEEVAPEEGGWKFPQGGTSYQYSDLSRPVSSRTGGFCTALGPDKLEARELGSGVLGFVDLARSGDPGLLAELHGRAAGMFKYLIMLLVGLPLVLGTATGARAGMGSSVGKCVLVVTGYELVSQGMIRLAASGDVSPFLCGWGAHILFAALGVYLTWRLD